MFTKLFSSITTSSIWNEDNNTRIVWITMLAMANKEGYISASVGGLAHEARVDREDCEKALEVLKSPDKDSRSKEFDGRRIEVIDGGFQLLNHAKYRAMRSEEERKEYMRTYMIEYRRTKNVNINVNKVSECKPPLAKAEADTEAEAEAEAYKEEDKLLTKKSKIPTEEEFLASLKASPAYAHFNVTVELSKMDTWLLAHPGRKKTRRFVANWLNNIEAPLSVNGQNKLSINDSWDEAKKQHDQKLNEAKNSN